jgi:hypothetical protein
MRLFAFVAALVMLAAAGFAGQALWTALQDPVPERAGPQSATPLVAVPQAGQAAPPLHDWPPVFGARVIAEPQPPARAAPEPEPQPPRPPAPPLESLGYSLKGVVSDGANRWALVSHPTGEQLLKVGDMLSDQYTISAIDVQGVWVQSDPDADPQLLGFAK